MSPQKPKWWQIYLTLPFMIGLLWLAHQSGLADRQDIWTQVGIVLLTYGLMAKWARANSEAIAEDQDNENDPNRRLIRASRRRSVHRHPAEPGSDEQCPSSTHPEMRVGRTKRYD